MEDKARPDTEARLDGLAGWATVSAAILGLCFGPASLLILCYGTFVQAWHSSFGWSIGQIAIGGSIISTMIMIISPLQGWLTDHFGARRVLLASVPVWALGLGAMAALPPSLPIFYLACALLPVVSFGLWPLVQLKIVTTWFDRHLGLALGVTNTGHGLGAILMPLALQFVFVHYGWRTAFLMLAAAVIILVLPVALWKLREHPAGAMLGRTMIGEGEDFGQVWRTRPFMLSAAAFGLLGAVSSALLINFVSILVASGFSTAQAVATQSALGIGSIAGRIGAGWLLDHIHGRWIGGGLSLAGILACLLVTSSGMGLPGAPVVAAILLGVVMGAEFDLLGVVIRRYYGTFAFGRVYGIIFSIFQFGSAIGIAAIALSHDWLGSYDTGLFVLAGLSAMVAVLLGNLPAYRFEPHKARHMTEPEPA